MKESSSGRENSIGRSSRRILLFLATALLAALLVAAGAAIANSKAAGSSNTVAVASQASPTPEPSPVQTLVSSAVREVSAASPTALPSPTLLPSLTPIPTSTPTEEPPLPSSSPVATATTASLISEAVALTKPAPLPTPVGVYSWTLQVPILMYHYISIPPEDADKYRVDLSVAPSTFREQMAYLAENGFESVDLYDLSLAITGKRDLPAKPVVLTFDDGYRDNYENAFPVLQDFGFRGTFFVVTQPIDDGNPDYLTWEMVKEMADAGMRIEPHSKTHADLSGREREFIIYEVLGAQETIAAHTGQTPRYFCYPAGRYDETTIEVIADLDFWGAVTTEGGKWLGYNERYQWSRVRMRNSTPLAEFASYVDPGDAVSGKTVES